MVVQLGFRAFIAMACIRSIPGQGTKILQSVQSGNKTKQNKKLSDPVILGVCGTVFSVTFQDAHGLASISPYLVPVTQMLQAPSSAQPPWMCETKKLFAPPGSASLLSGLTRFPWDAVFSQQLIQQLALDPISLVLLRNCVVFGSNCLLSSFMLHVCSFVSDSLWPHGL